MLRAMAPDVLTALTAPERLSLVEDQWALVRAGRQGVADFLTLAAGFGREQTSGVLSLVTSRLGFVHDYLTTSATRPGFEAFVRAQFRPSFDSLGVDAAAGDDDDRRALRATVISALGTTGADPDVIARSRAAVDRALARRARARSDRGHGARRRRRGLRRCRACTTPWSRQPTARLRRRNTIAT